MMDEEIIKKPKFIFNEFFKNNKYKILSIIILLIISLISIILIDEYKKIKMLKYPKILIKQEY